MADTKIPQQVVMFDNGPKPQDEMPARKKARNRGVLRSNPYPCFLSHPTGGHKAEDTAERAGKDPKLRELFTRVSQE